MKKIFLMIFALMFAVGIFGNASAKSFENISENNQMIFLDEEEDVEEVEEVAGEEEAGEEEAGEEEDQL